MTKWEYDRRCYGTESLVEELDIMGKEGWEAISVIRLEEDDGEVEYVVIFKRPVPTTGLARVFDPAKPYGIPWP